MIVGRPLTEFVMTKKCVLIGLLASLGMFGCSKNQAPEAASAPVPVAPQADSPAPDVPVVKTCLFSDEKDIQVEDWVDANNDFGFKMLAAIPGSNVVSPFSAQRALGMVLDGACNETAEQMRSALSLPNASNLSQMGAEVEKSVLNEEFDSVAVQVDNRVWVEKTYPLLGDYSAAIEAAYRAKPENVDFIGDAEAVRARINGDIARSTNDKIQNILPPGSLNSLTRLVLTNAVYFNGAWSSKFDKGGTQKADFTSTDGVIQVDMMHHKKRHDVYLEDDDFVAFNLGFSGSSYSMLVILPRVSEGQNVTEALANVEKKMSAATVRTIMENDMGRMVNLYMPKFRIETSNSLKKMLIDFGMKTPFSNAADFSRMSGSPDITIADVFQKAYIDVNEDGVEAAAATAAVMMMKTALRPMDDTVEIRVDHPFLYMLVENRTNAALFMGRVTKI